MNMPREQVNRLKIVLAEEQKSNKWLAEQLGKDQATISKWVTNSSQPDLKNLLRIAKTLNVDVARLLNADVLNEDQQVNLQSATSDNRAYHKSFLQIRLFFHTLSPMGRYWCIKRMNVNRRCRRRSRTSSSIITWQATSFKKFLFSNLDLIFLFITFVRN